MKRIIGAALLYPMFMSLACSNTGGGTGAGLGSDGNGANAGTGSSGSNNGGSGNKYNASTGGISASSTNTSIQNVDAGCAADVVPAQLTQVNILILLDKSGSMGYQNSTAGSWDNCATRWNPVVDTLNAFFSDPNSSRLYASLSFLPADGDDDGHVQSNQLYELCGVESAAH